jgi:hypothetical protein
MSQGGAILLEIVDFFTDHLLDDFSGFPHIGSSQVQYAFHTLSCPLPKVLIMSETYELEKEQAKKQPFYYYLWDSFGKPAAERRLLVKLDCSLLIYSVLGLICRYIDQTNINTACESLTGET